MYHILYDTQALPPTNLDSVEIFVFNIFLLDLQWVTPNTTDITAPSCLFISWCTAYDASTHVNISSIFVAPNALFSLRVQWTNLSILLNFPQSSMPIFETLVIKKLTDVSKSSLYLFIINDNFDTTEWNSSPFFHLIDGHLPLLQKNSWLLGMRLTWWCLTQELLFNPPTVWPCQLVLFCILYQRSSIRKCACYLSQQTDIQIVSSLCWWCMIVLLGLYVTACCHPCNRQ